MKLKNILSIIILVAITSTATYAGGGWPQPKGHGFFKLSQSMIIADQFFNPAGDIVDITTISIYSTAVYGEYGFSDRVTGAFHVPFFVRSTLNEVRRRQSGTIEPGDEVNALGDPILGLKYALTKDKWLALSATVSVGIPLGETEGGESRILQTGDGEFNQMIMIDASHSFYPKPFYSTVSVGFNNRTNGFSEEFRYGFEIGYTGIKNLIAVLKINGVESFNNGDTVTAGNGIFANNTEFLGVTPEINYNLNEKWGVSVSAGFAPYAKRILAAPNYSAGVYLQL